jgi:hypothetical protein
MSHVHYLKPERATRSKGRARPDEPLRQFCEIGLWEVCDVTPVHRHHIVMRSAGGTDESANTLDVCGPCHDYAHSHRAEARERGWIRPAGAA